MAQAMRTVLFASAAAVTFMLYNIGRKNIRIRVILRLLQHFVFETRENY